MTIAKGNVLPESDVDIALLANHSLGVSDRVALIGKIAAITGRPVDLVDLSSVGEPLLGEIFVQNFVVRFAPDQQSPDFFPHN